MASIPGARFPIIGASGTQGLLGPKESWRVYVLPRGGHASQASTGTLITFDSSAVALRFAAGDWIQVALDTANIRQVSASGGNSISVSGSNVTVSQNDRVFLIGRTQPTVTGGSATYTVPATIIYQRDDDGSTRFTNSMVTSDSDGLIQFWASQNTFDCIVQDSNQTNQGHVIDLEVGTSSIAPSTFGATVTINAALGVTGPATFGTTLTVHGNAGITGFLTVGTTLTVSGSVAGQTMTVNKNLGVTGFATVGQTLTVHGNAGVTGTMTVGQTLTVSANIVGSTLVATGSSLGAGFFASGISVGNGLSVSTGFLGVSQQPRVWLYMTSATVTVLAGTAQGVSTVHEWGGEHYDIGGMHSGASSRATVPTGGAGAYFLSTQIKWIGPQVNSSGSTWGVAIMKNGTKLLAESWTLDSVGVGGVSQAYTLGTHCISQGDPGDYFEAYVQVSGAGGSSKTIIGATASTTNFMVAKLF